MHYGYEPVNIIDLRQWLNCLVIAFLQFDHCSIKSVKKAQKLVAVNECHTYILWLLNINKLIK